MGNGMTTLIKILVVLVCFPTLNSPDRCDICKTYYRSGAYWSNDITLTKDNKYTESMGTCVYDYIYRGTWDLKGDTLTLMQLEKYNKRDKQTEVLKIPEIERYIFEQSDLVKLENVNGKLSVTNIRFTTEQQNKLIYKD